MNFLIRQAKSRNGDDVQLVVDRTDPMQLAVRFGTFSLSGVNYEFTEDQACDFTPGLPDRSWANGFIVKHRGTQALGFLIDEFTYGVVEEVYNWREGDYELIHMLFSFEIPASTTDLTGLPCAVEHIVPVEE